MKFFDLEKIKDSPDLDIMVENASIGRIIHLRDAGRRVLMNTGQYRAVTSVDKAHRVIEKFTGHKSRYLDKKRIRDAKNKVSKPVEEPNKAQNMEKYRAKEIVRVEKSLTLSGFEDCNRRSDLYLHAYWKSRRPPTPKPTAAAHYSMSGDAAAMYSLDFSR